MRAIYEDAQSDVRRSQLAEELLNSIISFMNKSKSDDQYTLPTVIMHTHSCPYVNSDMIHSKGIWGDLMVVFFNHDAEFVGRAARVHSSFDENKTRYIIFVKVDGMSEYRLTAKEIYMSLCNSAVRNTFRHEAQHILDKKRAKAKPIEGDPELDAGKSGTRDLNKYFNNPSELNAYFHNIAEPILHRLRWMHQVNGHDAIGLFDELPTSYREYLALRLTELRGIHKMFWEHLNEVNKRKIITRLMKLYDLFTKTLAAYEEQGAKYIEITKDT